MRILLLVGLLLSVNLCFAQSSYDIGLLPSININKSLPCEWRLQFKAEPRLILKSGVFTEKSNANFDYNLTDLTIIASKGIMNNKSFGFGYTFRIRDKSTFENRLIQLFTASKDYSNVSLEHRLRADQTFFKNQPIDFRLRYQLTLQVPLSRPSNDSNDFYYKLSNEYLTSLKAKKFNLEVRIINLIGYKFSSKSKLEWGLDYRAGSFIHDDLHNAFWMAIKWHWSI